MSGGDSVGAGLPRPPSPTTDGRGHRAPTQTEGGYTPFPTPGWTKTKYPAPDGGTDYVFAPQCPDVALQAIVSALRVLREIQIAPDLEAAKRIADGGIVTFRQAREARIDFLYPLKDVA